MSCQVGCDIVNECNASARFMWGIARGQKRYSEATPPDAVSFCPRSTFFEGSGLLSFFFGFDARRKYRCVMC